MTAGPASIDGWSGGRSAPKIQPVVRDTDAGAHYAATGFERQSVIDFRRSLDQDFDMIVHVYGIRNCDTVKKARRWLDTAGVSYDFHDYKIEGADPARLARWAGIVGWETLLNRAGTTFRKLGDADRADIDEIKALALMAAHPSLVKRPVVEYPGGLLVGFKPDRYAAAFA